MLKDDSDVEITAVIKRPPRKADNGEMTKLRAYYKPPIHAKNDVSSTILFIPPLLFLLASFLSLSSSSYFRFCATGQIEASLVLRVPVLP